MKYVLGAYSQLTFGSSNEDLELVLTNQIKPLLTLLYNNPDLSLLLRLGLNQYEYFETYHPEINMLIADLCKKGQLELLSGSSYDVVFPLVPAPERPVSIEKTTTYLRKHFYRKSAGLWCYNQIFTPSIIQTMVLSDLNYVVISGFNQIQGSSLVTKPFYMDEMGKGTIVFPTDDRFSKEICDFSKSHESADKLISSIDKLSSSLPNAFITVMINLDQIAFDPRTNEIFPVIFRNLGSSCTLPSKYLSDHDIQSTFYLPSGVYGRDFPTGKASSFNQIILETPVMDRHLTHINVLRDAIKECRKNSEDRKRLDNLLMKANSGSLYIPSLCRNRSIRNTADRNLCEIESILDSNQLLPPVLHLQNDRTSEHVISSKNLIAYLSEKGAQITRLNVLSAYLDILLHNANGLFCDTVRSNVTGKSVNLSNRQYLITPLDKKRQDFFAKGPQLELEKTHISVSKRFKLRQNTLVVDFGIENTGNTAIKDYSFETELNMCLLPETESSTPAKEYETEIIRIESKSLPFSVKVFFDSKMNVSEKHVFDKADSIRGEKSLYQYTQYVVGKTFSINPMEELHFTVALKIEKQTRRNT